MANLDLTGQNYVVFGLGHIGLPIARRLLEAGAAVYGCSKSGADRPLVAGLRGRYIGRFAPFAVDVTNVHSLNIFTTAVVKEGIAFNGLVYAVGDCPPGGLEAELKHSLDEPEAAPKLRQAMELHVHGLESVHISLYELMKCHSQIVVIGARVVDVTYDQLPPDMNFWPYVTAKTAQQTLVKQGLRYDNIADQTNKKIHWIAPSAVKGAFHANTPAHLTVPVSAVVDAVADALRAGHHVDRDVVPNPM